MNKIKPGTLWHGFLVPNCTDFSYLYFDKHNMNWTFSGTVRFAVFLVLCIMTGYIMALDNYTEDYLFYKTYMKLEEIPDEIPNQARGVYLFGNLLTEVRGAAFINLTSCLELSLSENIISEIHPRAFSGLYNLENFTLERNELTNLTVEMWQGLTKLKRLDLGRNHISQIELDCFASLKNIERLSLQENSIDEIKEEMLHGLNSLTKLLLCCNNIDSVSFPRLGKLLFLDLSYNNLRNLGSDTFDGKLFSLKELDLGMNTLVTIEDGSFRNMSKLTFLHLGNNKLEKFIPDVFDPDDFPDGHPSYLELDLSYNPIGCNQELCWLQEASEDGWLLWATGIGLYHQRCFKDPDNISGPFLFVNPGVGIHPSAVLNCSSNGTLLEVQLLFQI